MLFTELPLCDSLQEGLQAMNFKETTPVQEQAIPVLLEKKDVIACAQTGTGKTAAFLLPLLNNLQTDGHAENKINAIVMAPTRELAQQIDQQMEGFSYFTPFSSVAVYGGNDGEAWDVQKRGLLSGADVVIATPGRLISHANLYNIDFSGVKYFILDEADRMLDMGFYDDIMKIERFLPKDRQTVMFSATMPPKIQQLAKTILRNPEEIAIAISRPPETILQSAYICHEAQKINIVKHLFKEKAPNKVILFSGSKQKVKEITKILKSMGLSADEMHSDLDQSQRNQVMHEFKNERVNILVATDIVARGIDIDDISLVINFDVPYDAEDYVHRIGRTARAGDSGMAITFVSLDEQYRFSKIEQFLGKKIYRIPVPAELGESPEYDPASNNGNRGRSSRQISGGGKKKRKPSASAKPENHADKGDSGKKNHKPSPSEGQGRTTNQQQNKEQERRRKSLKNQDTQNSKETTHQTKPAQAVPDVKENEQTARASSAKKKKRRPAGEAGLNEANRSEGAPRNESSVRRNQNRNKLSDKRISNKTQTSGNNSSSRNEDSGNKKVVRKKVVKKSEFSKSEQAKGISAKKQEPSTQKGFIGKLLKWLPFGKK